MRAPRDLSTPLLQERAWSPNVSMSVPQMQMAGFATGRPSLRPIAMLSSGPDRRVPVLLDGGLG